MLGVKQSFLGALKTVRADTFVFQELHPSDLLQGR